MNKEELIREYAKQTDQTQIAGKEQINTLLNIIVSAVANEERVQVTGFASFSLRRGIAGKGLENVSNLTEGEDMSYVTPKIKFGEGFKQECVQAEIDRKNKASKKAKGKTGKAKTGKAKTGKKAKK